MRSLGAGTRRWWRPVCAAIVVGMVARPALAIPQDATEEALRGVERSLAEEDWPAVRSQLERAAAAHPEDCTVRAWLAWFEMDPAEALLAAGGCPVGPEDRGRWALLRALASERRDGPEGVRDALGEVDERHPLWPEDRALVRTLSGRHLEGHTIPLEARAEIALGGTSNAFAASPVDAARLEGPGSAVARPELHLRLRAPEGAITPSVDLGARGYGISTPAARELSPSRTLTLFGGLGRRVFFTDDWRTRTEWDLAGLRATSLAHRPAVLGEAFRFYRARRPVHDQVGGTLTAAAELHCAPPCGRGSHSRARSTNHRLLVSLRIGAGGNPWRARSRATPGRVALPYWDLGEWSVLRDDQMRRLLRQEEDLGTDCGCIVP